MRYGFSKFALVATFGFALADSSNKGDLYSVRCLQD